MSRQIDDQAALNQLISDCAEALDSSFSFAFQPIVEIGSLQLHGNEALVRGLSEESATSIMEAIRPENQYFFDQACRMRALEVAARLNMTGFLHLNCTQLRQENFATSLSATLNWCMRCGIDSQRVVLEVSNLKPLGRPRQLNNFQLQAEQAGFKVLADNFGATEAGLKRLAVLRPQFVKLDRTLIRNIDRSLRRQAIVRGIISTCRALGVELIANGVEHIEEADWLRDAGIRYGQGYLFARPAFEKAAEIATQIRPV
ncbi:MAG: EAL domain-containing protein [Pseudomonadota bacterium]